MRLLIIRSLSKFFFLKLYYVLLGREYKNTFVIVPKQARQGAKLRDQIQLICHGGVVWSKYRRDIRRVYSTQWPSGGGLFARSPA